MPGQGSGPAIGYLMYKLVRAAAQDSHAGEGTTILGNPITDPLLLPVSRASHGHSVSKYN